MRTAMNRFLTTAALAALVVGAVTLLPAQAQAHHFCRPYASYYYAPVTAYYAPPVYSYYAPPVTSYYAPPAYSYSYYAPAYYPPAVVTPGVSVGVYRYGFFGPRLYSRSYYYTPGYVIYP